MQLTQMHGKAPDVPDTPRIHIRRQKVYTFNRTYISTGITGSTTVDQFGALNFQLGSFPNSSEFTTLFDQYRFAQVTVTFIPVSSGQSTAPLYTVLDYDDSTTPTSVNDLFQYGNLMMSQSGQTVLRTVTPAFDVAAYSGAFTSYALSAKGQWCDVASPNVQWYGVKYCLPAFTGGPSTLVYNVHVEAILQFRNVR